MKEVLDDMTIDDEFEPIEMTISEGLEQGVPTTFYQIELEAGFDEEIDDILDDLELDNDGYTLESIFIKFLETETPELLNHITGYDSEDAAFVAYSDTEENQRKIAFQLQKLCTNTKLFKKTVKKHKKFIVERYSNNED